jgi:ubiquinol-cytochrome c reductase cytochrome b subunit
MIGSLWVAGINSPWSPNFDPPLLPEKVVGATSGPVFEGAKLFHAKGCLNCHLINQYGGRRGPNLTYIGDTLSQSDIVIRIVNGGVNMPAFGNILKPEELAQITAFLQSRKRQLRAEDQTSRAGSSSTSIAK